VALDTGSSGLRLLKSELYSNLNLPAVTNGGGAIGECLPFVIGATWGSVRYADIYLGGEVARNVPIQDIGDNPGGAAAIPKDCVNAGGTIQDTQALLGSNGILGVGLFQNDCDVCLTRAIPAAYYSCTSNGCTNSIVTAAQVVQNPVADFSQDNNGVLVNLPAVLSPDANTSLTGYLIFGIGTQQNNQLGSATVYATDVYGNFSTTYKGTAMNGSYIDSGSNALFFNDSSISTCHVNTWTYCPTSLQMQTPLTATNTAASGGATRYGEFQHRQCRPAFYQCQCRCGKYRRPIWRFTAPVCLGSAVLFWQAGIHGYLGCDAAKWCSDRAVLCILTMQCIFVGPTVPLIPAVCEPEGHP